MLLLYARITFIFTKISLKNIWRAAWKSKTCTSRFSFDECNSTHTSEHGCPLSQFSMSHEYLSRAHLTNFGTLKLCLVSTMILKLSF